jgi:hypothetical protein
MAPCGTKSRKVTKKVFTSPKAVMVALRKAGYSIGKVEDQKAPKS